jgi:hypothetical protein
VRRHRQRYLCAGLQTPALRALRIAKSLNEYPGKKVKIT